MRERFFWGISLCVLFLNLVPLASEEGVHSVLPLPNQLTFIPTPYYVGDRVTLRFTLDISFQKELLPPRSMPPLSWGVVHQIKVLPLGGKKGYEVTIVFTPYRTGRHLFPYLEFGPVRVEQIPVQVSSLLETNPQVPQPIRAQVMIPHKNYLILFLAGMFLAIPLFYFLWKRRLYSFLSRIWERYQGKHHYRRLLRKLDFLEQGITTIEPRTFYSFLHEDLRYYLSHRLDPKFIAYTTTEIGLFLGKNDLGAMLLEVFRRGDEVKFAGREVNTHALRVDLRSVRQVVGEMERTYWEQRRKVKE